MVSVKWGDDGMESATWDEDDQDLSGYDSSDTTSGSTSSGDSGSTSTSDYSVPSGYVRSVSSEAPEEMQSEQVTQVEDAMEGALDPTSVTTTTNEDGSTSLSAESNLGEEGTATTTNTPMDGENEPADPGGSLSKKVVLAVVAVVFALIAGGR
jgi:hypothetical protein